MIALFSSPTHIVRTTGDLQDGRHRWCPKLVCYAGDKHLFSRCIPSPPGNHWLRISGITGFHPHRKEAFSPVWEDRVEFVPSRWVAPHPRARFRHETAQLSVGILLRSEASSSSWGESYSCSSPRWVIPHPRARSHHEAVQLSVGIPLRSETSSPSWGESYSCSSLRRGDIYRSRRTCQSEPIEPSNREYSGYLR